MATCGQALAQAVPREAGPVNLPEVTITDTSDRHATEGSGQYTTRALSVGKLVQSPRETPQSVSVITRQQLDDRNFTKLEDAIKQTAGVNVTRFDGAGNFNSIQSRGFDVGTVQLDGIPISQGSNYATAMDMAIYDRVEVLRGPSGLMQGGGGEPGGTVNLVRKRALGALAMGANVSAGSFDFRRADVDVTGALNASGTLRGRFVGVTDQRLSHVDTLFNNKQLGYGTVEFDITPATTLSLGYTRQEVRAAYDRGLPAYADGRLPDVPRSTLVGLRGASHDLDTRDAFVELEHRFDDGGQLKFAARDVYRYLYYKYASSDSALAANGNVVLQNGELITDTTDRNLDLFYTSPLKLAGRTHRVLVGASRIDSDAPGSNFLAGPNLAFNIFRPNYDLAFPVVKLPGATSVTAKREHAVYGQVQMDVADRLKLLAGGRLSKVSVNTRSVLTGAITSSVEPGNQFVPSVAAIYDVDTRWSAYASYARSFVVQTALDKARNVLPPRTGSQYELGIKGELLNKRLQTHAALFQILDADRAIADPTTPNASIPGGEVRAQGFEAEASGQLRPGWDLMAGYAFTETTYLRAPAAQEGQVFSTVTPRHSVNLSTRYAFRDGPLRDWSVGAGVSYRSEFYAQSGALRLVSGNFALLNAQVGYQVNDQWSLNLSVENLTDKVYYEKVSGLTRQNFYGEPRRVAVAVKMRY
ncbi:MAG: TonB-dependent siderophore receptor [Pseudomonadota bacterium]